MADARWQAVRGEELRYQDHTWELTGEVDVRGTGDRLRARVKQVDGVRGEHAALQFGIVDGGGSLNPGDLGDVSAGLEREGDRHYLVVEKEPRTYRYELHSIEYE